MAGFGCVYCKLVFDEERALECHVRFQHPGNEFKSEMRSKQESLASLLGVLSQGSTGPSASTGIPMSEVRKHNTKDSVWVVLHGNVYDLTSFLPDHPGGEQVVLEWAGRDATKYWSAIHQKDWLKEYIKPEWSLGPVGPEPQLPADSRLRDYEQKIKRLEVEIERLTAAPSRPSKGLKDAMQVAQAVKALSPVPGTESTPQESPLSIVVPGKKVVVVGHGPVGHDFVVKLTGMVGDGALDITVFGEELLPAYDRVHLTEYFEHRDAEKLSVSSSKWFSEHGVTLRTGAQVEAIDRTSRQVTIRDAKSGKVEEQAYDVCVLCTGSYPFVPPLQNLSVDVPGVFVYRTIEDLEGMIMFARRSRKAGVIGGGLLGLEAAKAIYDLGQDSHVFEVAPFLMPTQLDEAGGKALERKIVEMDITVHTKAQLKTLVVEGGALKGVRLTDAEHEEEYFIELDMLVVSAGIRPRDELARQCGLAVGPRGGVVVNSRMQSSDPQIFAIGEVASFKGMCYGLIAPGWDQATVLAKNLEAAVLGPKKVGTGSGDQRPPEYEGSDLSTKLKLLGVDVASFGSSLDFWFGRQYDAAKAKALDLSFVTQSDPFGGLYRKLVFNADKKLLGGLLVGNADDYFSLLNLSQKSDLGGKEPGDLFLGGSGEADAGDLADDDVVCLCNTVTKKDIVDAVKEKDCATIADVKRCTTAGMGCGGCVLSTGFVPKILRITLESVGKSAFTGICPHFPFRRRELFEIIKMKELKTYDAVMQECAREGRLGGTTVHGCEVCKPVVASILASLWQEVPVADGLKELQDTNDSFLANIQRSGQYSVIPRVPGGEMSAEELLLLGTVAKRYNLWVKVTGAQRIGLFGANVWQLPQIWEEIVTGQSEYKDPEGRLSTKIDTQGMESGHAYGKALRAVKSCVGTSWCRFGQQDSVSMAVRLEERYKGFRAPHKWKMGVSGCMRECAEAQGKDIGLVATSKGWNLYICGNHGTSPKHAQLFMTDLDDESAVRYIDRVMTYYISTADPLTRTSKWLENLEGGMEHLREVVVDDKLGICAELDSRMEEQVNTFECEWKRVVETPSLRRKFRQFVNVEEKKYGDLEWKDVRRQRKIAVEDLPTVIGPAKIGKHKADDTWRWVDVGSTEDFPKNGGGAVKVSKTELAVYNFAALGQWYASQNSCPHKQLQVLSRGIVGMHGDVPKIACPIHKNTYDLSSGKGISNAGLNVATFDAKEENGRVLVHLPPDDALDSALARTDPVGNSDCGGVCETPKHLEW